MALRPYDPSVDGEEGAPQSPRLRPYVPESDGSLEALPGATLEQTAAMVKADRAGKPFTVAIDRGQVVARRGSPLDELDIPGPTRQAPISPVRSEGPGLSDLMPGTDAETGGAIAPYEAPPEVSADAIEAGRRRLSPLRAFTPERDAADAIALEEAAKTAAQRQPEPGAPRVGPTQAAADAMTTARARANQRQGAVLRAGVDDRTNAAIEAAGNPESMAVNQLASGVGQMHQATMGQLGAQYARLLPVLDRIDRGEAVPDVQDPLGYQHMSPEQRAEARRMVAGAISTAAQGVAQAGKAMRLIPREADADAMMKEIEAGNWSAAWQRFMSNPVAITQQFSLESLPMSAPGMAAGMAGAALGRLPGFMLGVAAGNYPIEYVAAFGEALQEFGVDLNDPKQVEEALKHPMVIQRIGDLGHRRGMTIAAVEAATARLYRPLSATAGLRKNVGRAAGNLAVGAIEEPLGEAAAQLASGQEFKPEEVVAEFLGAGPQAVGSTIARTAAEARQDDPARMLADTLNSSRLEGPGLSDFAAGSEGARAAALEKWRNEGFMRQKKAMGEDPAQAKEPQDAPPPPAKDTAAPAADLDKKSGIPPPAAKTEGDAGPGLDAIPPLDEERAARAIGRMDEQLRNDAQIVKADGAREVAAQREAMGEAEKENRIVGYVKDEKAAIRSAAQLSRETGRKHSADSVGGRWVVLDDGAPTVDEAAHQAASSPKNDLTPPTPAQAEAGNYKKGHQIVSGLDVSIENPAGSTRSGTDANGRKWESKMKTHYGYIKGTTGFDKDHLDVVMPEGTPTDFAGTVYVVNQNHANGRFDEHKVVVGAASEAEAKKQYLSNYEKGWESRIRSIVPMTMDEFKAWAYDKGKAGPKGGELKAKAGVPAVPQQLYAEWGGKKFPVESFEDASRKWDAARSEAYKQGIGGRDLGGGARIIDQDGKEVARISQNGRVWPPGEWKEGAKPLYDNREASDARDVEVPAQPAGDAAGPAAAGPATRERVQPAAATQEEAGQGADAAEVSSRSLTVHGKPTTKKQEALKAKMAEKEAERTQIIDNGDINPGEFIVRGDGHNLARFFIGKDGSPVRIKHFFESSQTRGMAEEAMQRFAESRATMAAQPKDPGQAAADSGEVWWTSTLTPAGRREAVKRAGLKKEAGLKSWRYLTDDEKAAVLEVRDTGYPENEGRDDGAKWDAMGYGERQALAEAQYRGMRKVVHRIAGSRWRELSDGERESMVKAMAAPPAAVETTEPSVTKQIVPGGTGSFVARAFTKDGDVPVTGYGDTEAEAIAAMRERAKAVTEGKASENPPIAEPVKPAQTTAQEGQDGQPGEAGDVPGRREGQAGGDGAARPRRGESVGARVARKGQEPSRQGGLFGDPAGASEAGEGRPDGAGSADAPGAARNPADVRPESGAADGLTDFEITDKTGVGEGGLKKKYRDNIAAIKILRALDEEKRVATPDEREQIARYVGWGGLKAVFDPESKGWAKEYAELKALLTEDEWKAARRSVLNAHYTSPAVVSAMWSGMERMGFTGGRVLEPSVGVGNFFGLMPKALRGAAQLHGVELDGLTSRIVAALYPRAKIAQSTGFQDYRIPAGYFDVAIGNPPFGSEPIVDDERSSYSGFSIHNYFFAKSIEKLREGGLLMMVVSHSFMDKLSPQVRSWIAKRAELVSAVRLPRTAFKENAGTEVVTDIVVLRRVPERSDHKGTWLDTSTFKNDAGDAEAQVNSYFMENPRNVLGRQDFTGSMYRANEYTVEPTGDLAEQLAAWVETLPAGTYEPIQRGAEADIVEAEIPDGVKVLSFYVAPDNTIMQRQPDALGKQQASRWAPTSDAAEKRMRGMIGLRNAMRAQMRLERSGASSESIEQHRRELNRLYDGFVKEHGYVNSQVNRRIFFDDPEVSLVLALEVDYDKGVSKTSKAVKEEGAEPRPPSAKKADIFTKRVLYPPQDEVVVTTAKDALIASLNFRGRLDLGYMSMVYGKGQDEIMAELGDVAYEDPQDGPVTADEYLAGDVKTKLEEAKAAAAKDDRYQRNVKALEKVIPSDLLPSQIFASPGAAWIAEQDYIDFLRDLTGHETVSVNYIAATAAWIVHASGAHDVAKETSEYGTQRAKASTLFSLLLNGRAPVIYDVTEDDRRVINTEQTEAASQKQNRIKDKWDGWIWSDPDRAARLAKVYNEKHNRTVARKFDGGHLTFPGMTPAIGLRPSQKNSIWRGLQSRQELMDHVVGAGKTFAGAALAMEMRRLGIARKPLFVVPNHLTLAWRQEFYRLYPTANVLAAEPSDFAKENRKKLFSKIVTGDWDAVVIGHSSLKKIGLPAETEERIVEEQLAELEIAIETTKRERGDRNIIRDMEKIKSTLEAKMKKRQQKVGERDDVVSFDEIGVDALFVDEFHEFKNLYFTTQKARIAGLGNPEGSAKAFDLFVKVRWLFETFGEKAPLITMTGTPVSNSLAEMFTVQRYMQYDQLKRDGLHLFDAWAKMFGDDQNVYEVAPSGVGYRVSQRFARFKNLPALMGMYHGFADVITLDDLKNNAKAEGKRFPVPKVKGGRPQIVVAKKSSMQDEFIGRPEVQRDADGAIAFDARIDQMPVIEEDKDGRTMLRIEGRGSRGPFESEEKARQEFVALALTPQVAFNKGSLLDRFANLAQLTRETNGKVNALSLTNLANKVALDYRLINPAAPDFPGSKINEAVKRMLAIYGRWSADRGTQLVFCDLSVPLSARKRMGVKESRLYVRDQNGALTHVRGTLATIEGFEGFPFYVVKQKDKTFTLYDPVVGKSLSSGHESRDEARKWVADFLEEEANREKWLKAREDNKAITEEEIEDYKNEQEFEDEDGGAEVSRADLEGVASSTGFSVYDDIKAKLIEGGVPEREIAFIHDFDTPKAKLELYGRVNRGEVRLLFGSTPKLGAGTNVQKRLVALHHIDAPWRPSDLEQREGRAIRQGNELYERDPDGFEVEILRYATEQTYDTRRWQILEHKASGIEQLRKYSGQLETEDVAGEAANAAEMKAAASGSPLILKETELRTEVKRLEALRRAHADAQAAMVGQVRSNESFIGTYGPKSLALYEKMLKTAAAHPMERGKMVEMTVNGKVAKDKNSAAALLTSAFNDATAKNPSNVVFRGLPFTVRSGYGETTVIVESALDETWVAHYQKDYKTQQYDFSGSGLVTRIENFIEDKLPGFVADVKGRIEKARKENEQLRPQIGKKFEDEARLEKLREEHADVQRRLMKENIATAIRPDERKAINDEIAARSRRLSEMGFDAEVKAFTGEAPLTSRRPSDDPARESRAFKRKLSASADAPIYWNGSVALHMPRVKDIVQPVNPRERRVAYDILDIPAYKKALADLEGAMPLPAAKRRAAARSTVGMALIDLEGDTIKALWNIEVNENQRGKGHGEAAVAAMLASQSEPILIKDIQQDAVGFWVKMGAKFPRSLDYMESSLSWWDYSLKNRGKLDAERAEARSEALGRNDGGREEGARGQGADAGAPRAQAAGPDAAGVAGQPVIRSAALAPAGRSITPTAAREIVAALGADAEVVTTSARLPKPLYDYLVSVGAESDSRGLFDPKTGKVYLIADQLRTTEEAAFVLMHESAHRGLRQLFGDGLSAVLLEIYRQNKNVRTQANLRRARYGESVETAIEEVIADMARRGQAKSLTGWQRLVEFVRTWLSNRGILINWTDEMVESLAGAAAEAGKRAGPTTIGGRDLAALKAAKGMPTMFSRGARDVTRTPAFRRWFGDSKVVDENGQPLVVYHGTAGDFPRFDERKLAASSGHATAAFGFFFSGADTASFFADISDSGEGKANVIPAFLSIARPYEMSAAEFTEIATDADAKEVRSIKDRLMADGHDGIVIRGDIESLWEELHEDNWIAFRPEQIKSAVGNNGEFNPANPEILLSRRSDDTIAGRLEQIKASGGKITDRIADRFTSDKTFNLWHKTIGTQYHKAMVDRDFRRVFNKGQDYLHEFSRAALEASDLAPRLLPKLEGFGDIFKTLRGGAKQADIRTAGKAILEGTLYDDSGDPFKGKLFTDDELRGQGLTGTQIELYREARAAIDASLDQVLLSEVANLARGFDKANPLPHTRFYVALARSDPGHAGEIVGDYLAQVAAEVQGQIDIGKPDSEEVAKLRAFKRALLDMATTLVEKQERVSALKAAGYAPLNRYGRYTVSAYTDSGVLTYFATYESEAEAKAAARALREDPDFEQSEIVTGIKSEMGFQLYRGLSPDTLELFAATLGVAQDQAFQTYLKVAKNSRSAMKRLIHRKGIAGFEADLTRSLAAFITSNARAAAGNWHMGELVAAADEIPQGKGDVKDEAVALVNYLQNPQEEAAAFRSFLFMNFLGGSLAAGLVNMTQPLTMTYPYLGQWGNVEAKRAVMRAIRDAAGSGDLSADLESALHRATEEGIVAPQEIHSLHAEAMRSFGSSLAWRRLQAFWGSFFSATEAFNRRVTFVAAYRTAKRIGSPDPYKFAVRAVEETQGIYNRGNRPNWARGPIGAPLFTFKQFAVTYVELLTRLPRRQVLVALAVMVLVAGIQGIPFAEDLEDIIDTIAQRLGYSWNTKQEMRRALTRYLGRLGADFVMHGASHLRGVPIDVQGRLGMGNLIPGTSIGKISADTAREVADVFGAAGALAKSMAEAAGKLVEGDVGGAARAIAPKAVTDVVKAVNMWQTGVYKDTKGRKVMEVTKGDAVAKAIGFQPQRVARESKKVGEQMQNIGLHKAVEARIADKMAQAVYERRTAKTDGQRADAAEKTAEARRELTRWNLKNPDARIVIEPSQIERRVKEIQSTRSDRIVKRAPRETRPEVREALE